MMTRPIARVFRAVSDRQRTARVGSSLRSFELAMGRVNMASAMADWGFHATLVRTFLALIMLSACSQEPVEQESGVSEPTQKQRAAAGADCRDEVVVAFERLRTSGRPYRMETASIISDQQTSRKTSEFVPPDRMRVVTSNGVPGYSPDETIRVGQRAWLNESGGWPWGWSEWDPRPADDLLARMEKIPADDVDARARIFREVRGLAISSPAFARSWVHFLALQNDYPIPADAVFECLGRVEFEGTVYLGYRTRLHEATVATVAPGVSNETEQQQLSRKPQVWRTVLVDRDGMLPAYDLVSQAYQLDNARHKVEYTYPNDIKIEPPLWCRLGLCGSVLW